MTIGSVAYWGWGRERVAGVRVAFVDAGVTERLQEIEVLFKQLPLTLDLSLV